MFTKLKLTESDINILLWALDEFINKKNTFDLSHIIRLQNINEYIINQHNKKYPKKFIPLDDEFVVFQRLLDNYSV